MVQLAPHLVYPTPFLVPTLGEERRSRRLGIGLNMYDVMATTRVGQARRERAEREQAGDYWAPDRHRTIDGEEVAELIPALADRDPTGAYLFYDCQTDDVRLVLTILGEAERFGAVCVEPAPRSPACSSDGGRADGVACRDLETGERVRDRGRQRDQRDRRLGRPHPPRGDPRRGAEVPRIAPSRGTHVTVAAREAAARSPPASSPPARSGRSSPCPGTGGR